MTVTKLRNGLWAPLVDGRFIEADFDATWGLTAYATKEAAIMSHQERKNAVREARQSAEAERKLIKALDLLHQLYQRSDENDSYASANQRVSYSALCLEVQTFLAKNGYREDYPHADIS